MRSNEQLLGYFLSLSKCTIGDKKMFIKKKEGLREAIVSLTFPSVHTWFSQSRQTSLSITNECSIR